MLIFYRSKSQLIETLKNMATGLLNKGPSMDWTADEGLYSRYKMWKQRCELLFSGPMNETDEPVKCKYLLYWAGERGLELFNSWGLSDDQEKVLKNYWDNFEAFIKPQSNELMAAWELNQTKQDNLSLEEFITKLRTLVKEANYLQEQQDRFLRDYLVIGMNSDKVRKECLKIGNDLTFAKARDMARVEESALRQLQQMSKSVEVNTVKGSQAGNQHGKQDISQSAKGEYHPPTGSGNMCRNCGLNSHSREQCPARNMQCYNCHKTGHFARACRSKKNKQVNEVGANNEQSANHAKDTHDQVFLGPIETACLGNSKNLVPSKEKALLGVKLSSSPQAEQTVVICKIDSGAETNILPMTLYRQLFPEAHTLGKPTVKLSAYGGTDIPNIGSCQIFAQSQYQPNPVPVHVEVVDINGPTIIGNTTAQKEQHKGISNEMPHVFKVFQATTT